MTVVKGCPLIPKDVALELLQEYEARQDQTITVKGLGLAVEAVVPPGQAREWLRQRLQEAPGLTRSEQQGYLKSLFPGISSEVISRACVDFDGRAGARLDGFSLGTDGCVDH